jgi:hypothetical protein
MEDKPMKCIKSNKTGNIIRVSDQQAHQTVGREWVYVPKSEWKSKDTAEVSHQVETKKAK